MSKSYPLASKMKNPYMKWYRELRNFTKKIELDPELIDRNEFLRLENILLWGIFFKQRERLKLSRHEKEQLAISASRMKGRTKVRASLLSPAQIIRYTRSAEGKQYVSLFPKKPRTVNLPAIHLESIIRSIVEEHPTWRKQQIFLETRKYFPKVPAFRVYDILYSIGFWDGKKNVRGLPWKKFLARFENITWAGDFFSIPVWTECGLISYYVLFFIHLRTQRVFIAGISPHATSEWLVQIIKSWTDVGSPFGPDAKFLIRDRDRRYTREVDWYFTQIGILPKMIAPGAPVMNYHAEQFVRKIKHECLNHCVFLSEKSLRTTLNAYLEYYHTQRPNTRFNGGCIIENETHWQRDGKITHTSELPGLLGYYYRKRDST